MSLIKSLPLIVTTFKEAMKGYGEGGISSIDRTSRDLSIKFVIAAVLALAVFMWLVPVIPLNLFGALIVIVFGFFFATVSSRMVGLVGSSNNPVSGMTIATLLITTIILKLTGNTGINGMITAIVIGSIICIIAAIAGDTSQDLKTGYIIGSTPRKQQLGEFIGVTVSALTIGGILYLLNTAWGYGTSQLPAPQATLMKMVVEGVMGGNLPWNLVFVGVAIAVVVEILRVPVLPFAIGLYLPIHLSTPIMAGGLIKLYFEKKKFPSDEHKKNVIDNGILYTSGMIAGEGLVGIILAVFAIIPLKSFGGSLGEFMDLSARGISLGNIGGLAFFALLLLSILKFTLWNKKIHD